MKDKRIWIVIICILVIGIAVTSYTRRVVQSHTQETALTETMTAQLPGMEETAAPSMEARTVPEPPDMKTAAGKEPSGQEEAAGLLETGASKSSEEPARSSAAPGDTAAAAAEGAGIQAETTTAAAAAARGRSAGEVSDYRQRLEDLDAQIQNMRDEETGSNVYSIKTSAQTELKMWESELNTVYNGLLELLSEEDAKKLVQEEQDWLKNRDAAAAESTGKSVSVDSIGYASNMAGLTRDRAYELVARYEQVKVSLIETPKTAP